MFNAQLVSINSFIGKNGNTYYTIDATACTLVNTYKNVTLWVNKTVYESAKRIPPMSKVTVSAGIDEAGRLTVSDIKLMEGK